MRIYLFDDEPIITITLQDFLSDLGHEVVSFGSTYELLDHLEKSPEPVDLIISDLHVPNGNGITLIREVHKRYPDISIMIIMGHDGPTLSTNEAISYGVYTYLHKPIRLSELELLLVRLSESRASRPRISSDSKVT